MAHKMLSKGKSGGKGNESASPKGDGSPADKPHGWSLWPKLSASASLRRSESASDISSLQPRASYLDIPEENHGGGGGGGHSINEQLMNSVTGGTGSSSSDKTAADLLGVRRSSINRHSDGDSASATLSPFQGSSIPVKVEMLVNPLYFSPPTHSAEKKSNNNNNGSSPTSSDIKSVSVNSSSSSHPPRGRRQAPRRAVLTLNTPTPHPPLPLHPGMTTAISVDRPPPLPPKTYQTSRSMSSTRSSIASNTSSSSAASLQSKSGGGGGSAQGTTTDTDSGLGTMITSSGISSTTDLGNAVQCNNNHCSGGGVHQVAPPPLPPLMVAASSCDHRRAICTNQHQTQPPLINTCNHHHQHSGPGHLSGVDQVDMDTSPPPPPPTSQQMGVTLRPKKSRGRAAHKCDYNCERAPDSPPPLPPPDSILFSLDTVVPLDGGGGITGESHHHHHHPHQHPPLTSPPGTITTGHCCQCHRRGNGGSGFDERNKENFNFTNIGSTPFASTSCTCQSPQQSPPPPPPPCRVGGTCCAHAEQPVSTTTTTSVCPQHGCPTCRRHPANLQRPYRRERTMQNHQQHQHHHHSTVQFSKSMRSYSIAETSSTTLKSSSSSLTVDCSGHDDPLLLLSAPPLLLRFLPSSATPT
ncbi:hypothetical protein TYRP_004191 [Tyrophagus putrescentiae]|nr:hypothetical protein TYRP_004191 [Tyrophagus putrescentiae]